MNDHAAIEELMAVRSLGGLDAGDPAHLEELMAAHGPDCAECGRLADAYREVAGRLAFAVAPEEIPEAMEDRVVERAVRPQRRLGIGGLRGIAAGVAAAVLLVAGGLGGYVLHGDGGAPQVVKLGAATGEGALTLVYQPEKQPAYLIGSKLQPLPQERVYELWVFKGSTPSPAGTFRAPTGDVVVPVNADLSGVSQVAVTVEPAPGSDAPTTSPIFTGEISSD
jgi:anti-sigma-K factor RskA